MTVSTIVVLKVFDGLILRVLVNTHHVVYSLAGVFDINAKVRDVFIENILIIFNYVGALDWTSDEHPS